MRILKTVAKVALGIVAGLAVLFVLFFLLTRGDYPVAETVSQDPLIPHVTIAGVTFHAETFGDPNAPALIAVHGGQGGDYRSILSLQALSDRYFVVFYDQRGSGLSPRVDPGEVSLASMLADLDSIVDHYGGGRKVDHAVLAEPGFLTSPLAEEFAEATKIRFSPGVLYHFVKTKFESLHVKGPDEHAADDYFGYQMNMYQGCDHPQAGYRCRGGGPEKGGSWRYGARAAASLLREAVDADGKFDIDLTQGVERFTGKVLFMAGECQQVIGVDWQNRQMEFFPGAELAVIPHAGHEMFAENPQASIAAVREYLGAPTW